MNGAFSTKVLRDLTRDKVRTALVLVAMTLGLISSGIIVDSRSILSREMDRNYRETIPASATLFMAGDASEALEAAKAFPGVADAEPRERLIGRIKANGRWTPFWIFVCPDPGATRIDRFWIDGNGPAPGAGEILIERAATGFLQADVGSRVDISLPGEKEASLAVTGTAHAPGLAPAWMERIGYGFVSRETAMDIGFDGDYTELKILSSGDPLDMDANRALAASLARNLESRGFSVTRTEILPPREHPHASQMNSLLYLLGIFGIMAFILASVLCASVIASLMARQKRETGVLKALGATSGRIVSGYLALSLGISAISLLIALPAARALSIVYAKFTAGILNFTIASMYVPPASYAIQAVLGFLAPLLATLIPVLSRSGMSVRELLSDIPARFGRKYAGKKSARTAAPALLPLRNAARRPLRLAFAAGAIGLGMALYLAAGNLASSITRTIDDTAEAQAFDIAVRLSEPRPQESFSAVIRNVGGIQDVALAVRSQAVVVAADGSESDRAFTAILLNPEEGIIAPDLVSGSWLDGKNQNAFVANNLFTNREGLSMGDEVRVRAGKSIRAGRIIGTVQETIGSPTIYGVLFPGQAVNAAFIALEENADVDGSCASLERALSQSGFPVESVRPLEEMKKAIKEHMVLITRFLGAASVMVFIVGIAAIVSALGLGVIERTREIGVLRATGAPPSRIMSMIGLEGAVMGGLGYLIAICVAFPLSMAASAALGLIFFESPLLFKPNIALMAAALPFALVTGFLAALAPGWSAARRSTASNLRYE
jgi:putative ABC transport system permease protein